MIKKIIIGVVLIGMNFSVYLFNDSKKITAGIYGKNYSSQEIIKKLTKRYVIHQTDKDEFALCTISKLITKEYKKEDDATNYEVWKKK